LGLGETNMDVVSVPNILEKIMETIKNFPIMMLRGTLKEEDIPIGCTHLNSLRLGKL